MILGHNPGCEILVDALSREDVVMKTATVALLTRDLPDWQAAFDAGSWKLERILYPRDL